MKQIYKQLNWVIQLFLLILTAQTLMAQTIPVSGSVTDSQDGTYLVGVTVLEKGTTNGTVTDIDGNFSLKVPRGATLVFSFIGYDPVEVEIKDDSPLIISLKTKATMLNETVVVGYGTQRKRNLTGSISKVSGAELNEIPVPSFEAGLQGKAAGVQVIQSSGLAGAGSAIRIRGISSISAGGDPLYVIDGIPIMQNQEIPGSSGSGVPGSQRIGGINTNPLNFINPNDIESIEVLKDASATAIYGSRGANGVVLITTKRGTTGGKGKPVFSVDYRLGFSNPTKLYDLLDNKEYVRLYQEAYENDAIYGTGSFYDGPWVNLPGNISREQALATNTNWQKEMVRTGVSHEIDFSFRQGSKKLGSYVGISYNNENSFLKENSFDRFTGRANLDYQVAKSFKIGVTALFSHDINNHVPVAWTGGLGKAQSAALPYFPVYSDSATFGYYQFPQGQNGPGNPLAQINLDKLRTREMRTLSTLYLNWEIIKNLSLRVDGSVDYLDRQYDDYQKAFRDIPQGIRNSSYVINWDTKAVLNYGLDLGSNNHFDFMIGSEALSSSSNYTILTLTGIDAPIFEKPTYPPQFNPDGSANSDYRYEVLPVSKYSFISYFGRINYSFKNKYLITALIRRDGSSRFGINNKFGTFPAFSLGWIVSEENFLKGNPVLTFLKLKTGYGKTGNAEIPNYAQYGTTNTTSPTTYNGQNIIFQDNLANPDISWETTKTFDVGVEYGFMQDRIQGEFSYYYKRTEDLFLNVAVQTSTGWANTLKNVGAMKNSGIEFTISSVNIQRSFVWRTDFNIAYNDNKVLDIGGANPDALAGTGDTRVIVGQPIGVNYLIPVVGIDPADGMPIYLDLNNNETKVYNLDDRRVLGHPYPDYIGGLTNTFSYGAWQLSFMFNYSVGNKIYDDAEKFQLNDLGWNLTTDALNRWQKPGDVTNVARLTLGQSGIERIRNTDEYLHDGSYLRLKSLLLTYKFNKEILSRLKLRQASISFIATNLLTFTKYKGLDPEIFRDMENVLQKNTSPSVTYLTPPQARTFSLQISVSF